MLDAVEQKRPMWRKLSAWGERHEPLSSYLTLVLHVLVGSWARLDRERRIIAADGAEKPPAAAKENFLVAESLLRYSADKFSRPCACYRHFCWTWTAQGYISAISGGSGDRRCFCFDNRRTAWSSRRRARPLGSAMRANGDAALRRD